MFICEDCIKKYNVSTNLSLHMFRSTGPCEDCKKFKPCYDLHHSLFKTKLEIQNKIEEALKDKKLKIPPRYGVSRDEERCPKCGRPPSRWHLD